MQWASALSKQSVARSALQDVLDDVGGTLGATPDLAVLFVSSQHAHEAHALVSALRATWPSAELVGCAGAGVLADGVEAEGEPAIALLAATLPGVDIEPLRITEQPERGDAEAWRQAVGVQRDDVRALLVLPAPEECDPETLVRGLDVAFPDAVTVGGVPSGFDALGVAPLFLGGQAYQDGMVGLALCGDLVVDTLVAQGCRPVGDPMIITSCQDNIIYNLDRGRPDEMIRKLYAAMTGRDRDLFQDSLFLGIEMADKVGAYTQGDFLIRAVLGVDPERGAMAVGAQVDPFQVVQFHLRDKQTSAEDLVARLKAYREAHPEPPAAALVFQCMGRGKALYQSDDHDSRLIRDALGAIPMAGFFGGGEIGPVAGRTFVHGYTASIALFRPAR